MKRRFYLKQHKRVNTFIPWIDPPGFVEMNESVASFLIFRIKIRPFERQTRHMAHGCGGYSSFGNNAVTFSRKPQRLRELIIEHRSPDH